VSNLDIYKLKQIEEEVALYRVDLTFSDKNGEFPFKVTEIDLHDDIIFVFPAICLTFDV
jgi:hypothetical protein